jgi:hypothetical protein
MVHVVINIMHTQCRISITTIWSLRLTLAQDYDIVYLSTGLRKPRKYVKFGERYLAEKVASYIPIFNCKSQKGSIEALNFLTIIS